MLLMITIIFLIEMIFGIALLKNYLKTETQYIKCDKCGSYYTIYIGHCWTMEEQPCPMCYIGDMID